MALFSWAILTLTLVPIGQPAGRLRIALHLTGYVFITPAAWQTTRYRRLGTLTVLRVNLWFAPRYREWAASGA